MKNVLLLVHDDPGQEARLQAALDLTRALDGHLRCVDVTIIPPLLIDDYTGNGGALLLDDERQRESKNKAALESRLAHEDIAWDWIDITGDPAIAVLDAAALADIIVLNSGAEGFPNMRDIASQIVLRGRKPILAVPDEQKQMRFDRALVAWDGQASCAATLRACTPLLKLANAVELFMVRDNAERTDPSEAAEYLSRHDIHATVKLVDDRMRIPDVVIEEESDEWKPDYIVMGAYGRGRLVEMFGGVTKRMLGRSKWPLLLGH